MEIKNRTIALLIDSDNVSKKYFATILEELNQYGRVTYRRLYGDFTKDKANGWKDALLQYSIEQIQQVAFTSGKNATDSKMIIDAMDILYKGGVDCFCLATSDSDFTNLAMRFRNDNLVVIGAGEERTPQSFKRACDIFIPIDEILNAEKAKNSENLENQKQTANKQNKTAKNKNKQPTNPRLAAIIKTAKKIISDGADVDGWMYFSMFMSDLRQQENDFNPKLYGFSNCRPINFFKNLTENDKPVFILEKESTTDKIKINK